MKSIGVALQAILLGLMFLPQGKITGEGSVNAFQLLDLSTAAGHPGDSLLLFCYGMRPSHGYYPVYPGDKG